MPSARAARAVDGESGVATIAHAPDDALEAHGAAARGRAALDDEAELSERAGLDLAVVGEADEDGRATALMPPVQRELLAVPEGEHPGLGRAFVEVGVRDEGEAEGAEVGAGDVACEAAEGSPPRLLHETITS